MGPTARKPTFSGGLALASAPYAVPVVTPEMTIKALVKIVCDRLERKFLVRITHPLGSVSSPFSPARRPLRLQKNPCCQARRRRLFDLKIIAVFRLGL